MNGRAMHVDIKLTELSKRLPYVEEWSDSSLLRSPSPTKIFWNVFVAYMRIELIPVACYATPRRKAIIRTRVNLFYVNSSFHESSDVYLATTVSLFSSPTSLAGSSFLMLLVSGRKKHATAEKAQNSAVTRKEIHQMLG